MLLKFYFIVLELNKCSMRKIAPSADTPKTSALNHGNYKKNQGDLKKPKMAGQKNEKNIIINLSCVSRTK